MQSSDSHSVSRPRGPLPKEDALACGSANDRGAHRPIGRQQGKAEGREGKETKGRDPRTPQEGDKAMSLTPWKNVPDISPPEGHI